MDQRLGIDQGDPSEAGGEQDLGHAFRIAGPRGSEVGEGFFAAFKNKGIVVPFPQRGAHVYAEPVT